MEKKSLKNNNKFYFNKIEKE